MTWIIYNPKARTYYVERCCVGPRFGKKKEAKRYRLKRYAEREIANDWRFIDCKPVPEQQGGGK